MKKGFTLAEVLITLAIIGVVAALTIPSVILNTNQTEYKTALKKAVSVLNQAVSLHLALENMSPSEASTATDLIDLLQSQLNTVKAATGTCSSFTVADSTALDETANFDKCGFTTTDGIQFAYFTNEISVGEDPNASSAATDKSLKVKNTLKNGATAAGDTTATNGCTDTTPCYIAVDVNGSKNPNSMTTDAQAPRDRFVLEFKGANGTTVTPAGSGAEIMFAK